MTLSRQTLENPNRDKLIAELNSRGIGSMCYYPVPLHLQEAFKYLGYKMGDFPISEQLSREVLSLPLYPELTEEQVDSVAAAIKDVVGKSITTFAPALVEPMPVMPAVAPAVALG